MYADRHFRMHRKAEIKQTKKVAYIVDNKKRNLAVG